MLGCFIQNGEELSLLSTLRTACQWVLGEVGGGKAPKHLSAAEHDLDELVMVLSV